MLILQNGICQVQKQLFSTKGGILSFREVLDKNLVKERVESFKLQKEEMLRYIKEIDSYQGKY